jgi:hypothetical protein
MAESETSICNKALTALGANTIIALTDETDEARICSEHYNACRDAVLEDDDWSFAIKTSKLSAEVTTVSSPSGFGTVDPVNWGSVYPEPPDLLRIIEVRGGDDRDIDWVCEGRHIYCNEGSIILRGVYRVEDPSFFSPRFVQALVYFLAANISLPLTESPARMDAMMARYGYEKVRARSNDGRQGRNRRRYMKVRR